MSWVFELKVLLFVCRCSSNIMSVGCGWPERVAGCLACCCCWFRGAKSRLKLSSYWIRFSIKFYFSETLADKTPALFWPSKRVSSALPDRRAKTFLFLQYHSSVLTKLGFPSHTKKVPRYLSRGCPGPFHASMRLVLPRGLRT